MRVDKKYEQWKAVTESDFVTLFILQMTMG